MRRSRKTVQVPRLLGISYETRCWLIALACVVYGNADVLDELGDELLRIARADHKAEA